MGLRLTWRAYRHPADEIYREALKSAAASVGATIRLDKPAQEGKHDLREASTDRTVTLYLAYQPDDFPFFMALGEALACPWMEIRIQEGNHWDYSLYVGTAHVDQFSSDPSYFGEKRSECRGNAALLASEWGVERESIERYLRHWTRWWWFRLSGKAYPDDKFGYGEYEHVNDFIRKLKIDEPIHPTHTIILRADA